MLVVINSWAPCGLVRAEHATFLANTAANLHINGIEVAFSISDMEDIDDALSHARANAAVRQADLLFRIWWNAWGPIGNDGQTFWMAAFRTMFAQIPGQTVIPPDEVELMRTKLGEVDTCVFDGPLEGPEETVLYQHELNGIGRLAEYWDTELARSPISLMRLGTERQNAIGVQAPSFLFRPAIGVMKYEPRYQ